MGQYRNYIWLSLTTLNLVLVSCPIILFHSARTTEEYLIAVLVLLACLFLLTVVDTVMISIGTALGIRVGESCQSSGTNRLRRCAQER